MNHTTLPYIAAQILQNWLVCLIYLTRNETVVRAQITNLRQRERSAQLIGFLSVLLAFSSLSLFVVTKRFQKRPDKRNSLRLRLRSDSLLSQWKGLFYASRSLMKVKILPIRKSGIRCIKEGRKVSGRPFLLSVLKSENVIERMQLRCSLSLSKCLFIEFTTSGP